jgi:hypothetical protein
MSTVDRGRQTLSGLFPMRSSKAWSSESFVGVSGCWLAERVDRVYGTVCAEFTP